MSQINSFTDSSALPIDEGYGPSMPNLEEQSCVQQSSHKEVYAKITLGDNEKESDRTRQLEQFEEDSNYSFDSREELVSAPAYNLKRWGNVPLFQNGTMTTDTKQISEYNNINPIKEWRKNHLTQLEKQLDLVLIEEEEDDEVQKSTHFDFAKQLKPEKPSNSSIYNLSSSESLVASSSGLGDIIEEDEDGLHRKNEDSLEIRDSVHSDITFGRKSDLESPNLEGEASKSSKSNFIRGFLSRAKDPASKRAIESKIPKYNKKDLEGKNDFLKSSTTKSGSFNVLGGRSASDGSPKTPLLARLYNIGKSSKKSPQKEKTELENFESDWKKFNLFEDAEEGEFDGDFNAIHEMKRFLKKYQIVRQIGTGGHSTVRLATRLSDSASVVAKFIHSSNVWHWNREIDNRKIPLEISMMKIFSEIKLKNVIRYFEHYQIGERFIIIMEYLGEDWIDLYDFIELHGPVEESIATQIFKEVCETIQTMHGLGYSHNDIKDENVMINKKTLELKLIDFGSTVPLTSSPTTTFYGTQKFSSPEALSSKSYVLAEQEVWALGTLLYVLLFKMDPFANDEEILDLNISHRIFALRTKPYGKNNPPIQITDEAAESIVMMLSKMPEDRPHIDHLLDLPIFHVNNEEYYE